MKLVKLAVISLLFFFVLFTLIGLLFPSQIRVANSVVVQQSPDIVKRALQLNPGWANWHPALQENGKLRDADKDTGIFESGGREVLIYNRSADSNSISYLMSGGGSVTETQIMLLPVSAGSSQTQVVWHETQKLKWYPWDRFKGLVLEKARKSYLDTVLHHFKTYIDTAKVY